MREIAKELAGQTVVVQINTEENPVLASRFAVRGIPALMILKRGKMLSSMSGVRGKQTIVDWYKKSAR